MAPTAFSTDPFSWPELGLQKENEKPWWAAKRMKVSAVRIFSPTRLPTPAALSNTSLVGTPPQNSNTAFRPSHTHSEVSPQKHCASETLEKGKVTTR